MLSEERRREILELLQKEGRVLVGELAKHFDTSLITIRKDLEFLHHQGQLERTHGGALPLRTGALHDQTLQEKERLHRKEKMRIAEAAVKMIRPGQVVILDSGTTTTAIARGCRHFRSLTIVTNAINIVEELAGTSVEVILTGGTLRTNSFSLVGPLAEESLRRLNADMLFLAVDGFDITYSGWGLEDSDLLIRLLRAGIRRKDGNFATGVLHLWHPENDRSLLPDNQRRLDAIASADRVRSIVGLSTLDAAEPSLASVQRPDRVSQ